MKIRQFSNVYPRLSAVLSGLKEELVLKNIFFHQKNKQTDTREVVKNKRKFDISTISGMKIAKQVVENKDRFKTLQHVNLGSCYSTILLKLN